MFLEELDYSLPDSLIARKPLEQRDAARLMVIDENSASLHHRRVSELPKLLKPSLFVFNDTKVIPARLRGKKNGTGGRVEMLIFECLQKTNGKERWRAMAAASKGFRAGQKISFSDRLHAEVLEVLSDGYLDVVLYSDDGGDLGMVLAECAQIPLPPYLEREPEALDMQRYQTVFASKPGAVAAPTAGLHFTPALIEALQEEGHQIAFVTLHVGPGTFQPIRSNDLADHRMHEEAYEIGEACREKIVAAQKQGRAVVAVGTTVARTLESAMNDEGVLHAKKGRSTLFIRPPYRFRCIDVLLTNFHLPRSTLLALVMAKAGVELIRQAYACAVKEQYRFYSYGDAMLLSPSRWLVEGA